MKYWFIFFVFMFFSCLSEEKKNDDTTVSQDEISLGVSLIVLGTIQDAGSPHIGCNKDCCKELFTQPDNTRKVVSLGVVDFEANKTFLFEATPNITSQVKHLHQFAKSEKQLPDGIFLTHAHMGHYSGLMYLGKEAINANEVNVFAMPRMKQFLEQHGPWNQLVTLKNITLQPIFAGQEIVLTPQLNVIPFLIPHRDEYSETVGYSIEGPSKKVLFIPDIDKWEKWETSIIDAISKVDYAFIDATFYDGVEINNRDISEIPHPFIIESMVLFKELPHSEKQKIHFIHFNHTNPVLHKQSEAYKRVIENGFQIAEMGQRINL